MLLRKHVFDMTDTFNNLRILLVTPTVPYPPNWGFGIRVYQFLRHLAQSHRVSLVCYAQPEDADKVAELEKICAFGAYRPQSTRNADGQARRAACQRVFVPLVSNGQPANGRDAGSAHAPVKRCEPFDVVQIESSQLGSYDYGTAPLFVVDEHNLEYELLYRMYQTESSPLRRYYNGLEYRKFRREEEACWQRADACILTSERERIILNEHLPGKQPAHVAPNGVDIEYFQPSKAPVSPDSLVFTGLISYRPNTDAVLFFVKEVLPHIVAVRPNTVFSIVGMGAPDEVTRLAGPNVVVTGEVPDVRPYIEAASVFVVPLRMGSGTRLKVLEGLAMGKPMVSTRLGCEGIGVQPGEHLLVEDEPVDVRPRHAAPDGRIANSGYARLGASGRALVEREYSWTSIVQCMEAFHTPQLLTEKRQAQ